MTPEPVPLRESGGRGLSENWNYLLSDVRRLGSRCDGARHRAGGAWPRSPLHHVSAAVSPAIVPAPDLFSRSRCRQLSPVLVSGLRSGACSADARGGQDSPASAAPLPL